MQLCSEKSLTSPPVFQSLGCLLYALCYFKSPFDCVFERGDSVALAVQSAESVGFPSDAAGIYSADLRQLITWMLTVNPAMRPHLSQITDRVRQMLRQRAETSAQLHQKQDANGRRTKAPSQLAVST
jgi:serine/threonine protein kinase